MAPVPVTITFPSPEAVQRYVNAACWHGGLGDNEQPPDGSTRGEFARKVLIRVMIDMVDSYERQKATKDTLGIS